MRSRSFGIVLFVVAVLLLPTFGVEACGPWFEPDVFVSTAHPDDLPAFAQGKLGILQAGFDSNEYAVAYRYLSGGKLSDAERQTYAPSSGLTTTDNNGRLLNPDQIYELQEAERKKQLSNQPPARWLAERDKYLPAGALPQQKPTFPTDYAGNIVFDENYLNCPDAAFSNAVLTLRNRATAWGAQSPLLADWIHAQDAVFSNCDGKNVVTPLPAPTDSPLLLHSDRAYQIAAATFYAKRYDDAAQQFTAIAADTHSPWNAWGLYLAARATVRKAFAMGKPTDPYSSDLADYDKPTMQRAQQMLEALLAQPNPTPSRASIQQELNFIRIRTEPGKRASEISAALAGPMPDSNFENDIKDLNWLLVKELKFDDQPPLFAWISAWRGETSAAAFATWQRDHTLPWLVLALAKANPSDSFAPALVDQAAKIPHDSPAYDTVFYHRVRLLIGLHRNDETRALLDAALPPLRLQKPSSHLNALLGERLAVSRTFSEFLAYAPRAALSTGSEGAEDLQGQCNEAAHAVNHQADCPQLKQPLLFDQDSVAILNQKTPLSLLIEAAHSSALPQNLRQDIAIMAWTRSIMLNDSANAAKLSPMLPRTVSQLAGTSTDFPAALAILRNPGIRPYLEPGVSRVASYSSFDELRDNWWCKPWEPDYSDQSPPPVPPVPSPDVMNPGQNAVASDEYQRLQKLPDSIALIGQRVVDYAKSHPDDAQIPEALALTVRASHYACQPDNPATTGAAGSPYTPVSKAAFQLLHSRYPKSPWALKTRYYY